MADEQNASTSAASDARSTRSTTKRKMVSTSDHDSGDSVFSPPVKRYKLRATTKQGCCFSGKPLSDNEISTTGSSCTIRGPATSYWGPTQYNRLNFQTPIQHCVDNSWSSMLEFLSEERTVIGVELNGPDLLTTAMKKKVMDACTGSPIDEYIEEVIAYLREKKLSWNRIGTNRSQELIATIETHVAEKVSEDQATSDLRKQVWLSDVKECIGEALLLCYATERSERDLDEFVVCMMQLTQHQDQLIDKTKYFRISQTGKSKVKFEICGSLVTSMTNILWEAAYMGKLLTKCFPLLMCENKGSYTEREVETTSKKRNADHMNLPQVIGQCISMADKSVFETKDYKIVYHVSLMSTQKLLITRTHVAKSTLKVIKDGCPIPDRNELDPSFVFETPFYIVNNWEYLTKRLYKIIQIFQKIGYFIASEKPEAEKC